MAVGFGFAGAGAQHLLLYFDDAFSDSYDTWIDSKTMYTTLHVVRYLTAAHVYTAYLLFWLIPASIMLLCGYSMSEFLG